MTSWQHAVCMRGTGRELKLLDLTAASFLCYHGRSLSDEILLKDIGVTELSQREAIFKAAHRLSQPPEVNSPDNSSEDSWGSGNSSRPSSSLAIFSGGKLVQMLPVAAKCLCCSRVVCTPYMNGFRSSSASLGHVQEIPRQALHNMPLLCFWLWSRPVHLVGLAPDMFSMGYRHDIDQIV